MTPIPLTDLTRQRDDLLRGLAENRRAAARLAADLSAGLHCLLSRAGWHAGSAADPTAWSPDNPALGQCAVTALLVQDLTGLEIRRTEAIRPDGGIESHYFNDLLGAPLDPTAGQFQPGTEIDYLNAGPRTGGHATTRAYLLASPDTRARYERLRAAADLDALGALLAPARS